MFTSDLYILQNIYSCRIRYLEVQLKEGVLTTFGMDVVV